MTLCLGLMIETVAVRADVPSFDTKSDNFVGDVRAALVATFALLRLEADKCGNRDVLGQMKTAAQCREVLRSLCKAPKSVASTSARGRASDSVRGNAPVLQEVPTFST